MHEYQQSFRAMGCPCEVRLHAEIAGDGNRWATLAVQRALEIEQKYSRFRDDSVAADIQRSAGTAAGYVADAETAALLDYAQTAWLQSDGLFDITSGILRRVWDFKSSVLPMQQDIDALLPLIGWGQVQWEQPTLYLPSGMQVDFGGFVKEYAADNIAALLREQGCRHGLVDLGGDLAIIGPHPDGSDWQVGIRNPRVPDSAIAQIAVARGGITTSGDYERSMLVDGQIFGHILNPKTGWPVQGLASVSVLAEHCIVAGSASTIAMLKGQGGEAWLQELGLPYLCVSAEGRISGALQ